MIAANGLGPMKEPVRSLGIRQEPIQPEINPALVYLRGLASGGRKGIVSRLKQVSKLMNLGEDFELVRWEDLRHQHVGEIKRKLIENKRSQRTIDLTIQTIRSVAKTAFDLGLMDCNEYLRIYKIKTAWPGGPLLGGPILDDQKLSSMQRHIPESTIWTETRNAAILEIFYASGLQSSDLVALNLNDYNKETQEVIVNKKGREDRIFRLSDIGGRSVLLWLEVRGDERGPLFCSFYGKALSTRQIHRIVKGRATKAGIERCSPRDLRRTFICKLFETGVGLNEAKKLAGHRQTLTTARYRKQREGEQKSKRKPGRGRKPYFNNKMIQPRDAD